MLIDWMKRRFAPQTAWSTLDQATLPLGHWPESEATSVPDKVLGRSLLYRFKRDVMTVVSNLNRGVHHQDCAVLARQTLFVQQQLLHSLYHDISIPLAVRKQLADYHAQCVKTSIVDKRQSKNRHLTG